MTFLLKSRMIELSDYNDVYWNYNMISFYPHKKHYYYMEIEQMKQDDFKFKEDLICSIMKLDHFEFRVILYLQCVVDMNVPR